MQIIQNVEKQNNLKHVLSEVFQRGDTQPLLAREQSTQVRSLAVFPGVMEI